MFTISLRKTGGSTVATIPKTILELLNIKAGDTVECELTDKGLTMLRNSSGLRRRKLKIKKFNLETLLDEHEKIRPMLDQEYKAWDALLPVGEEIVK
ncbi:AbrB/MazE/SpoVT family DNA-binding domain-containing protein [Turicimonas muris]|uniref:AbrB/MazE/SpoVT family DNA-binding domain-containing protein n=1 Tax=Turicimonas muris TaxID=1796652 RepID=UPI002493E882|nr:AbrB/MazE/SpoVT family DNA-binding domain-containing protein [Turicimonas muris]